MIANEGSATHPHNTANMPKVLEMEQKMSNAEVLDWLKQTRARHAREDAEDKAAGIEPTSRPQNFLDAMTKHERHLKSDAYPYEKNPSAYAGKNNDISLRKFNDEHFEAIHVPVFEKFKAAIKAKLISKEEGAEEMEKEQLRKEITEEELLMIHNHAPKNVEMLQPMLENWEERYTLEELQVIVDVIKNVYRQDELAGQGGSISDQ
jgi:hypothetical protein